MRSIPHALLSVLLLHNAGNALASTARTTPAVPYAAVSAEEGAESLLQAMTEELLAALPADGYEGDAEDVSLHSVVNVVHMLNAMLDRVSLGLASWNNRRNLAKIEAAMRPRGDVEVHTIRELFEREAESTNLHRPGGHIHDDSGACGLLWIRRTLHFFVELVRESIQGGESGPPTTLSAPAKQAYVVALGKYHSWMTRGFFKTLLSTLPSSERYVPALMAPLVPQPGGPQQDQGSHAPPTRMRGSASAQPPDSQDQWSRAHRDAQAFVDAADRVLRQWERLHHEFDFEDDRRF